MDINKLNIENINYIDFDNIEKYNGDITTLTHSVIVRIFRKIKNSRFYRNRCRLR